uniref:Hsp20/alpha crystallin family protein n=1 Tax=candidate division CPR3 bacterium TaxID=2268181 RepID=A0A7C4R479_UNCC3
MRSEIEKFFSDDDFGSFGSNTKLIANDEEETEGQLSIDMYQTDDDVVVKAPVAGVDPGELEISVTEDMVHIKGHRKEEHKEETKDYFLSECYWGSFSRSQSLPVPVIAEKAEASINKKGVLTIKIPKANKSKSKILKIKSE